MLLLDVQVVQLIHLHRRTLSEDSCDSHWLSQPMQLLTRCDVCDPYFMPGMLALFVQQRRLLRKLLLLQLACRSGKPSLPSLPASQASLHVLVRTPKLSRPSGGS